jgi:L-fucose mutarotase
MLKTLSTLHTPDLLHALASMGHGDELAIVDAHFPAATMARRLIRLDAAEAPAVL